jgi:hypothetical protein
LSVCIALEVNKKSPKRIRPRASEGEGIRLKPKEGKEGKADIAQPFIYGFHGVEFYKCLQTGLFK